MCLFKKRETLKMENTAELLGPAMQALRKYKEKHRDESPVAVIHGDDVLGAEHTQTLLKHHCIYEITDGWYYEGSWPSARLSRTNTSHASRSETCCSRYRPATRPSQRRSNGSPATD